MENVSYGLAPKAEAFSGLSLIFPARVFWASWRRRNFKCWKMPHICSQWFTLSYYSILSSYYFINKFHLNLVTRLTTSVQDQQMLMSCFSLQVPVCCQCLSKSLTLPPQFSSEFKVIEFQLVLHFWMFL